MKICTCQHCIHWYITDPGQIKLPGRGACLKTRTVEGGGQMTRAHDDSRAHAVADVVGAFEHRVAISQLETTADFGCNQFEIETDGE